LLQVDPVLGIPFNITIKTVDNLLQQNATETATAIVACGGGVVVAGGNGYGFVRA
jgi:hypothetical protein